MIRIAGLAALVWLGITPAPCLAQVDLNAPPAQALPPAQVQPPVQVLPPGQIAPPGKELPPVAPAPDPDPMEEPSADASSALEMVLTARPVAYIESSGLWDDNFVTMRTSIDQVRAEIDRLRLKANGDPLGVYLDTDDNGFRFQLMIPIEALPPASVTVSPPVKFGTSPTGKALRFESKGAFDEVDSLYEAISAYLDERQLTMRTPYIEEYQTPLADSTDPEFRMRIYVILDETKPPPQEQPQPLLPQEPQMPAAPVPVPAQ